MITGRLATVLQVMCMHFTPGLTLSSNNLQTGKSAMMATWPLQVWCSSVHAPLRSIRGYGPRSKIWRRKCAKSWITLPRIVRFPSNFTQGLDTWRPKYHKSSRSRGQRSMSQRDVTLAKICQIVNNSAGGCSISITFNTDYDHVPPDIPQTFKVNGSKIKVNIAWHDVLAWKMVTFHERIAWLSLNFAQTIPEHSATRDTCSRS